MRHRAILLSTTMFAALAASVPASAQEGIEVVTVTARQRVESIQTVPVSVTALSAQQMEKLFVRDMTDLTRSAPGLVVEAVGAINRTAAVLYARGIGYSGIDQAIDPSVGVSVDGHFYPRNLGMLQQMFDAQSVEILRGPQGTLYGKNTTGGVIKITTNAPVQGVYSLEGYLRMGNYGRSDYGAVVNIPLTDTLAFRLAAQSQYSDGYVRNDYVNPTTGLPANSRDRWLSGDDVKTFRGSLKWDPNENFSGRLTLVYIKDRSDSAGGQNGSYSTAGNQPGFGTNNATGTSLVPIQTADTIGNANPGFGMPGGPTQAFVVSRNYPNDDRGDNLYGTMNLSWKAPWFDVESTTAVQNSQQLTYSDFDDTGSALFETFTRKRARYFQQDIRLLSNDPDARLTWVAGLWFNNYWFRTEQTFTTLLAVLPAAAWQKEGSVQNEWSLAPFAQVDYKITDKWQVTGGMRFTSQTKTLNRLFQVAIGTYGTPANQTTGSRTWNAVTYHAGTKYQLTDDAMVYADFSTGFKSGSFNSRAPNGTTLGLAVDAILGPAKPEKVTAYEIGAKTQWFDNRLRVNMAAFWNEYKDLQVQFFIPLGTGAPQILANNAFQRARGVELEIAAIPIEHLNVSAAISYLDSKYTSFVANLGNNTFKPVVCNNVTVDHAAAGPCYLQPYRSPQWSMKYQIDYDWTLPRGIGMLTPSFSVGVETSHQTDLNNSSQGFQPTYVMMDGSLTYTDPSERYKFSIWGKNIGNVTHKLSVVPSSNIFTQLYFAEPRTFGVNLSVKMSSEEK